MRLYCTTITLLIVAMRIAIYRSPWSDRLLAAHLHLCRLRLDLREVTK